MSDGDTEERLFERYRARGDVAALGELFDRTSAALLRVALHFTRDGAAAEDLVQATFLRAIEVRAQWDDRRPLLPWLFGLLHNRARHERWQRDRAPDPARLQHAPDEDPAGRAAHSEFDAAVDTAIAALPETYRAVLRLHLAYGHAPAEIAHALERPAATVRSQLARGLALLRGVLPAGFAGGAALLLASGRGLATMKPAVLAHAHAHAAATTAAAVPAAAAGGTATTFAGLLAGMVMGKKLVVALTALFVSLAGIWSLSERPDPVPSGAPRAPSAAVAAAVAGAAATVAPAEREPVPVGGAIVVPAPRPTGALRIRCRYADDGSPAWGIRVDVELHGVRDAAMQRRSVRTDQHGVVVVGDLPAVEAFVRADRGGEQRAGVEAGAERTVDLVIPRGVDVRGRAVDEHGQGVAGAAIWLGERAHTLVDGAFVATTDAAGCFVLRSVEPERLLSATLAGRRSAAVEPVRGEPGGAVEVELVLRGAGATLAGTVLGPDGAPAAEARVFVGRRNVSGRWSRRSHAQHRPPLQTRTGADGTFAVHGLEPGSEHHLWVRAAGSSLWFGTVELAATGATNVCVQLHRGAAVTGRATLADGRPAVGAFVDHRSSAWFVLRGSAWNDAGPEWGHYAVRVDDDGRYRLDDVAPGTLVLHANVDEMEAHGSLVVADGETATWDPVLIEIALRGRVVDERGAPLARVAVDASPPHGQGNHGSATTDDEGRFVMRRLAQVPYVVTCHVDDDPRTRPLATVRGVEPGPDELVVRVPAANVPTATIVGRVLDRDGRPPEFASVAIATSGLDGQPGTPVDAKTGTFRIGPLPHGAWRVQVTVGREWPDVRRSGWSEPFSLAPNQELDLGTLQMPATGSVSITATDAEGAPLPRQTVALEDSFGWGEVAWQVGDLDGGRLQVDDVAPGAYRVRLGGTNGLPTVYAPLVVAPGATARVAVVVPRGIALELVLPPVSEPVPIRLHFEWRRDGERFHRYWNDWQANAERTWQEVMLPGAWEVVVTSATGKIATTRFGVADGEPPGRRVTIAMP